MFRLFFGNHLDSKEGVKHMPALQLADYPTNRWTIICGLLSDEKTFTQRQTMENDYYFEHFKFCLEQWFKYLGRKIHQ
jgi:hypothetical protein